MTFEGQLADAIIAAAEKNRSVIEGEISSATAEISASIKRMVDAAPVPKGVLGVFWPTIRASLDAEIDALVNSYGPDLLFNLLDTEAKAFAKGIGG